MTKIASFILPFSSLLRRYLICDLSDQKLSLGLKMIIPDLDNFFCGIRSIFPGRILLGICQVFLHELFKRFILNILDRNVEIPHSDHCLFIQLSLSWRLENDGAHLEELTIVFWSN